MHLAARVLIDRLALEVGFMMLATRIAGHRLSSGPRRQIEGLGVGVRSRWCKHVAVTALRRGNLSRSLPW